MGRIFILVGLMPDLGKRLRYQAIVAATPASSVPPRLVGVLDGAPEGIIQFHELPGVGSIGDEKRGDLKPSPPPPPPKESRASRMQCA